MAETSPNSPVRKECSRCGGLLVYQEAAIIPGDPAAPRGSHRSAAHAQPAWTCISCGHVEPQERRGRVSPAAEPRAET